MCRRNPCPDRAGRTRRWTRTRAQRALPKSVAGLGVRSVEGAAAGEQVLGGGLGVGGDGGHVDGHDSSVSDDVPALHPHVGHVVAAGGEHEVGGHVEVGAVEHGDEVQGPEVDADDA